MTANITKVELGKSTVYADAITSVSIPGVQNISITTEKEREMLNTLYADNEIRLNNEITHTISIDMVTGLDRVGTSTHNEYFFISKVVKSTIPSIFNFSARLRVEGNDITYVFMDCRISNVSFDTSTDDLPATISFDITCNNLSFSGIPEKVG